MRFAPLKDCLAALVLATLATGLALPADADTLHRDHVYADSFGNLVVDSAAGYKRIIIGQGALAGKLAGYTGAGQPEIVYSDGEDEAAADCYRAPAFVKGRSYMYGLSDGEMPDLTPCRR